jgi:hypothetical protein
MPANSPLSTRTSALATASWLFLSFGDGLLLPLMFGPNTDRSDANLISYRQSIDVALTNIPESGGQDPSVGTRNSSALKLLDCFWHQIHAGVHENAHPIPYSPDYIKVARALASIA